MNDTTLTIIGSLTTDPELRFTQSGTAVANFTVASNPRRFDKATSEWRDAEPLFLRCTVWRQAAENVAESLTRGTRVIVTGQLVQRSYETSAGERRTSYELNVTEIGASLQFTQVKIVKADRGTGRTAAEANPGGHEDEPPF
ncbi:MAG: single-stranded DNA-binding protein [Pseudonocardiaceae bacterium]